MTFSLLYDTEITLFYPSKPKEISFKSTIFTTKSMSDNWVCEPKWNGWRTFVVSDKQGKVNVYNKTGSKLSYFTADINIPPDSYFDCEWIDRRTTLKNKLIVFGCLKYKGLLLEGHKEIESRNILANCFKNNEIVSNDIGISLVERFDNDFDKHFLRLRDEKIIEGLVLKNTISKIEISSKGQFKSFNQLKVKK